MAEVAPRRLTPEEGAKLVKLLPHLNLGDGGMKAVKRVKKVMQIVFGAEDPSTPPGDNPEGTSEVVADALRKRWPHLGRGVL